MIKVINLTKIYRSDSTVEVKALDNVSFEVQKGEFVAIMGPSGSGKSTLMHILGALDTPTSGEYWLEGKLIANLSEDELAEIRNKKIGFVFQAYNLLPRINALKNVELPMMYGGISREEREKKAKELLDKVGLGDRLYHRPNQLSGGQQQRVAIARALSTNPSLILADEPTGNIATNQAMEIMEIFEDLNDQGHTIVMITHEPEIAQYAKRIIQIRDGKIIGDIQNGSKRKLVKKIKFRK